MAKLEWRMVSVELASEKDTALLDVLVELADQGFAPTFIVPVFSGHLQVFATRPRGQPALSSRPPQPTQRLPKQGASWLQPLKPRTK